MINNYPNRLLTQHKGENHENLPRRDKRRL